MARMVGIVLRRVLTEWATGTGEGSLPLNCPSANDKMRLATRGGAVVARWAHNPKVVGSNPAPATNKKVAYLGDFFNFIYSSKINLNVYSLRFIQLCL